MLLTIDVGNTSAHFGVFRGNKLIEQFRASSVGISEDQKIRKWVSGHLPAGRHGQNIREVIVSSVVPSVSKTIKKWFPQAIFVSYKNVGIKLKVNKPGQVGADRLVNALAAYTLYKGPCVVVDFGTATTFDVVSAKGEYLGGIIAPGIEMARDSLHYKTAQLPKIAIAAPKSLIGKDTVSAMRSGLVYGYAAMVEGLVRNIKLQTSNFKINPKSKIQIVATGGYAKLVCKYAKVVDRIDEELTLQGLRLIGDKICRKN